MRLTKEAAPAAEADLTPMIDMTFQLIAFFMVLINFSQSEQNDKVKLPSSELVKPVDAPIDFPIIVHMTMDDTIVISGDEISLAALQSRLQPDLALLALEGKTAADANVIIRGSESVPGGRVQDLIKRFQDIGFANFMLRAKEKLE